MVRMPVGTCMGRRLHFLPRHMLAWLLPVFMSMAALNASAASLPWTATTNGEAMHETAVLKIGNREVVTFRATLGSATPADRVISAKKEVEQLSDAELRATISVNETKLGDTPGLAIHAGTRKLFGLVEADIDPLSDHTLQQEADQAAGRLSIALRALRQQREPDTILRGAALSVSALALFALAVWFIVRLRLRVARTLEASARRRMARITHGGHAMTAPMKIILEGLVAFASWIAIFFAGYMCATIVLGSFPYTSPWGEALAGNLMRLLEQLGQRMVDSAPGIMTVAVIFIVARMSARALSAFLRAIEQERISSPFLYPDTARATRWLLLAVLWLFALAIAYPYIPGSDSAAFQGISVIAGLMLSLGSAGIVNQAMNGLVLVYSRALIKGDVVKIDDEKGVVTQVGLLSTKIKTCRHEEITIPNTVVVGTQIKNFSRRAPDKGASVTTSVAVGYDASWRQVVAMLGQAARRTRGVRHDIAPRILQRELSDFYVRYELAAFIVRPDTYDLVLDELHGHIQDIFNEYGVQIMSPHFETQPAGKVLVPKERWFAWPARKDASSKNPTNGRAPDRHPDAAP